MKIFNKIAILFFGLLLPIVSFGQTFGSPSLSSELGVEIIPTYPKPNQNVSINLTLYSGDLNSADITWYQNGKNVLSGKGEKRYSFKMGPAGTETEIEIRIKLMGGSSFTKTFTLGGADVDLVWEASTYTPPFYKGKAMHGFQGYLKVVAMPDFVKNDTLVSPKNLIYEWSNGTSVYESQSGYGRDTLVLNGSLLGREEQIDVLVTDPTTNLVANDFIVIGPIEPEVVFYENSPYYGPIFDKAIRSLELEAEETQILAAPYNLSKEPLGKLVYDWRLNGVSVPELKNSRTAIFKKPEEGSGQSAISLSIENLNRVLQQGSGQVNIEFKND
jgi:hypothetical protein